MKCIAQKQARYLQGACFSQCSRDIRGSRGPTWRSTSMCFAISYHIHLFWFCFPKQTSAPCGSQWVKRRRSMHTTASTLLQLRSTSACYLCCCVRSLDMMQVQVQTHMHAHIWSGFVPAVHLEAFFFTWYWWRSSASAEEPALSTSIGCIFQQTSAVARLPRLTFYVLVVLWWNWSEIYSHTACACVGAFYNVWSKNEG